MKVCLLFVGIAFYDYFEIQYGLFFLHPKTLPDVITSNRNSAHRSIALHDQLGGKKRASSGPLSGPSSLAEILNAVGDA